MAKRRTTHRQDEPPEADDALAFRAAVRDVKPLPQKPRPAGLMQTAKPARRTRRPHPPAAADGLDAEMPLLDPMPSDAGAGHLPIVSGADPLLFQRVGVQTQVMRRLRRGLFPIEDELDLHGLSQLAARDCLSRFLASSRDSGRRCVRIIHGKGYRSGARGPVLKMAVDLWLRRHLDVMAFTSARPLDGGTGAVYVLLRA